MASWRLWWRKAVTGLAAILLVGFQMIGSVSTPVDMNASGYQYTWSEQGMRATLVEINPFTQLEGEVLEEHVRGYLKRGNDKRRKAAS